MYTAFEIHFGAGSGPVPSELAREGVSDNPEVGTFLVDVTPTERGISYVLANDFGFTGHTFSVGFSSRSYATQTPPAFLGAVFDWARSTLAKIEGDAIFVANDTPDSSTELCRRVKGQLIFKDLGPQHTREFVAAHRAFREGACVA